MKIALLTTSRADWGLLENLAIRIYDDPDCELQLIVSGSHVSPEFGLTIKQIKIPHAARVEVLLSSDTKTAVSKAIGLGCISFADTFERLSPDWLIVLGDRFETFSAVSAAYASGIPVAHISGGEVTSGSLDDGWRHCITKMSYLHFVYEEEYRRRVVQLGEHPDRVFNFGHIGLEGLEKYRSQEKEDFYLILWHPETIKPVIWQNSDLTVLFNFLDPLAYKYKLVFCLSNGDDGSRKINNRIKEFCSGLDSTKLYSFGSIWVENLNRNEFLTYLGQAKAIIGNSSAGIYEAPVVGTPTINIGSRQDGRIRNPLIIDCKMVTSEFKAALDKLETQEFKELVAKANIKRSFMTSAKILDQIKQTRTPQGGKGFYDC